jgi:hypothetical protein
MKESVDSRPETVYCQLIRTEKEPDMKYGVFFNYGYNDEWEMFASDDLDEAIKYAESNAEDEIDKEGDSVEVIWFKADGEAVTEWMLSYEDIT